MEPIKQEIINNIFENGDKLITGPILQTVLIDMIDDVNVKDQEILSKTGSWDNAVTQIPNLATKEEVTNLSESVARDLENVDVDLTGYATEQWVESKGYLTEHQDISNLATKVEVTSLSESVARDLANVPEGVATEAWVQSQDYASKSYVNDAVSSSSVDLTGYATETWVQSQGYLTEHQDISGLATKSELTEAKNIIQDDMITLSGSMAKTIDDYTAGLITEIQNQDYASKTYVNEAVSGINLSDYATKGELNSVSQSVQTDISNLATKTELNDTKNSLQGNITGLSESVARDLANVDVDLTGYATETWVQNQGYLTEHQDLSDYATKVYVNEAKSTLESNLNNLSSSVSNDIQNKGEEVKTWVQNQGYLTEHQDVSGLATKSELTEAKNNLQGNITSLSESVARDLASVPEGVATETWVQNQGYLKEHQDISNLATKSELNSVSQSVQTDITNLSESVANSAVWKKGTGTDSIVQKLTGANEANTPTATETGAIAIGSYTTASGMYSHAEGVRTNASGVSSHAEGSYTNASGNFSHAEGDTTVASNEYEHAQGRYNHSSENQIFSIGTGTSTADRRNAVSVLEVNNGGRYTSSFFVQNVGGYDGTNPTPGTNDLATVINNLPSGGGSSETLWKKGTGTDSMVQAIADGTNLPTATANRAIAVGYDTTASGDYSHAEGLRTVASKYSSHAEGSDTVASGIISHAEGDHTKASEAGSHAEGYQTIASEAYSHAEGFYTEASGMSSHAEGYYTTASGESSHAEGGYTLTSNQYEHAQGQYNHNSTNQIFSVGAGEKIGETVTKRNAVSILVVPNSETQINTASFFVQNVGGYDGTNPTPGTNDLATVINSLSSSGGSSGGESGNYLPLTGGTLTGDLRVNSSMGVGTGPQGTYCLAVGNSTTNTGGSHYALAVGENCQVKGAYGGVSLGRENVVNAAFGLATGFRCRTTYMAGYAGGCRSTASANFAFAAGFGAEATRVGQVVLGAYNELDPSGNNDSTGSYAVILANGKSSTWHQDRPGSITRSNGLAIKWDGGIDIKYQGSTVTLQDKLNEIEAKISSGGTATSTETWTFTLDDGSTVTKNILMA